MPLWAYNCSLGRIVNLQLQLSIVDLCTLHNVTHCFTSLHIVEDCPRIEQPIPGLFRACSFLQLFCLNVEAAAVGRNDQVNVLFQASMRTQLTIPDQLRQTNTICNDPRLKSVWECLRVSNIFSSPCLLMIFCAADSPLRCTSWYVCLYCLFVCLFDIFYSRLTLAMYLMICLLASVFPLPDSPAKQS